jgi:hypothetical protein
VEWKEQAKEKKIFLGMKGIEYQALRCHNSEDHNMKGHVKLFRALKRRFVKTERYTRYV